MADQTPRDEAQALYEQMTVPDLQAELGERNLVKTGTKPELVARLLDADFPLPPSPDAADPAAAGDDEGSTPPAEAPADPEAGDPEAEDGDLCLVCWPEGWPTKDTPNASCEHGVWDR